MTMLSDKDIVERVQKEGMIENFVANQVREVEDLGKVISYGVSSYGYDMRIGYDFKVFTNLRSRLIDPKNFDESCFETVKARQGVDQWVPIPPNSFALGTSLERFKIPRDIVCLCLGKSTYARCGIIVNITPLEPCWGGHITIEISNTAPLPCVIYPGEGIAQIIFLCNEQRDSGTPGYGTICERSYADKQGKYMNQGPEVTLARV